jgi:hypothetical protein
VRGLTAREERYARQRDEAMAARAFAAVDRVVLREQSPTGAFWKLDPTVIEHTAGCLFMGGRFWPWQVLDRVHPPRHAGARVGCSATVRRSHDGLLSPGDGAWTRRRRCGARRHRGDGGRARVLDDAAGALIEAAGGWELMSCGRDREGRGSTSRRSTGLLSRRSRSLAVRGCGQNLDF